MSQQDQIMLAAIAYKQNSGIDTTLLGVVEKLKAHGVKMAGVIQRSVDPSDGCCGAMSLVEIASMQDVSISQNLGKNSRGCRLDPRGLIEMAGIISQKIDEGADLLIINKFGIAESEGDGLLPCICEAVEKGVPVLTAVRAPYIEAWQKFHGGLGIELPHAQDAVVDWCQGVMKARV